MSQPSEKALAESMAKAQRTGSIREILDAAHDPALGLDRSVCARDVLVPLYREMPLAVANLCDEVLDRSGRLLGEVRIEAMRS